MIVIKKIAWHSSYKNLLSVDFDLKMEKLQSEWNRYKLKNQLQPDPFFTINLNYEIIQTVWKYKILLNSI